MFVVDLECEKAHEFEGWYDTFLEYQALADGGDVTCPLCGSANVTRVLSTGGFLSARGDALTTRSSSSRGSPTNAPPMAPPVVDLATQKAMAKVYQLIQRTHEDVGASFAVEAKAIAHGDAPPRLIRGQATPTEEREMHDEGILFAKVPIPDIEQN